MLKLKNSFKKLWIILLSRNKKPNQEQWVLDRREVCRTCEFNTINIEKLPLKKRIIKFLSDFYSKIMGKEEVDTLGNCSACDMCSVYFKSETDVEYCPKNKWKK